MKKIATYFAIIVAITYASYASTAINFIGLDKQDGSNVKIDSVLIKNLTKNKAVVTTASSYDLDNFDKQGVEEVLSYGFSITGVYPNEFKKDVTFNIDANSPCLLNINITDIRGKIIVQGSFPIEPGSNEFLLKGGQLAAGTYLINANCNEKSVYSKVIKVGSGNSSSAEISFIGNKQMLSTVPNTSNSNSNKKTGSGEIQSADSYDFIGFSKGYKNDTLLNQTPVDGDDITFEFEKLPAPQLSLNNLVPMVLFHLKDSDGTKVVKGADCIIIFEPNWKTQLILADSADLLTFPGTYSIVNNQLKLVFNTDGFAADATFDIDVSADTVQLPFKIFSAGAGSSKWLNSALPPEILVQTVFKTATTSDSISCDAAIQRAFDYINFYKDLSVTKNSNDSPLQLYVGSKITSVFKTKTGVTINYENGPWVDVELYGWPNHPSAAPLAISSLASDPRVHLNVKPPGNNSSDPKEKTALFFAPFHIFKTFAWYNALAFNLGINDYPYNGDFLSGSENFNFDDMDVLLTDAGYKVTQFRDEQADIFALIDNLKGKSPGIVVMNTHGTSSGTLALGQRFGLIHKDPNDPNSQVFWMDANNVWKQQWPALRDKLKKAGYADLLTYDGGTEDQPRTIIMMSEDGGVRPQTSNLLFAITPSFWKWLKEKQKTDFSSSLVYIAACSTDETPDLREAIEAKAYFAWSSPAPPQLAGAIFQYLCSSLKRYSRSTEEVFYNLIRVSTTRQMIYKEDKILDNEIFDKQQSKSFRFLYNNFHGYGYDGVDLFEYKNWGWFDTAKVNMGSVWMLLFAGRWGQDAEGGADALFSCWNNYWKDGKMPGLADPGCNASTPGKIPNQYEFDYSVYLLTGKKKLNAAIIPIPRWTLRDGDTK